MSERVRRRRSLRLNRPPAGLLVPLISDTEMLNTPRYDGEDNTAMGTSSMVDVTADCGSFWEEVDEDRLYRKRKSRRSNIGFYSMKTVGDGNTENNSEISGKASVSNLALDSPEIELARRPFPEADCLVETPILNITDDQRNISETKTPVVLGDKSLPYIQTPTSVGVGRNNVLNHSVKKVDDSLMNELNTPSSYQNASVSCPPSCEDESEDSLLICTPDLSKFKKNIRFKCTLDFSEFDQTPSKGETSLDKSQDSIHESPIVGFMYDKLSASDVVRRRRSTSHRFATRSAGDSQTPRTCISEPRRLIASQTKKAKSPLSDNSSANTSVEKSEKSLDLSVQSSGSSQSHTNTTPSSGTYTSCVEDRLEDFLTLSSAEPSPLASPLISVAGSEPSPHVSPLISVAGSEPSPLASPLISVAGSGSSQNSSPSTGLSNSDTVAPAVNREVPAKLDIQSASDGNLNRDSSDCKFTSENLNRHEVQIKEGSNEVSEEGNTPQQDNASSIGVSETPETVTVEGKEESETAISEPSNCENSQETDKTKERNIASDVCEMFRSLARKFSGNRKKKRRAIGTKRNQKTARVEDSKTKSDLLVEGSLLTANHDDVGVFSFRKELPSVEDTSQSLTVTAGVDAAAVAGTNSLDFSPYLQSREKDSDTIATPDSPVWKLQCDQPEFNKDDTENKISCELNTGLDACVTDLTESVLQEKTSNVEPSLKDESQCVPKKRGRPKRRSIEMSILQNECKEFQKSETLPKEDEEEENVSVRRSRRQRRNSLEMFRYQSQTPQDILEEAFTSDSPDSQDSDGEYKTKKTRGRKKAALAIQEENLEDLYRNKNYTLPTERMWETVFESPEKTKQPSLLQSRRKYRRTIAFDTVAPAKIRKRLQKAATQGWDVTGKKRKSIPLEEVRTKIALLASELESY